MTSSMSTKDIPAEELKELRTMFNTLDKGRTGIIGPAELSDLMKTIGVPHTPEDVVALLKEVDEDGNGEIEFHEFARAMSRRISLPGLAPQLIIDAFRTIAGKTVELQGKVVPVPPGCIHTSQIRYVLERLGPLDGVPTASLRVLQGTEWAHARQERRREGARLAREKERDKKGSGAAVGSFSAGASPEAVRSSEATGSMSIRLPAPTGTGGGAGGGLPEGTPGRYGETPGGGGSAGASPRPGAATPLPAFEPGAIASLLSSMTPDEKGWINYETAVANFLNER